MLLARDYTEDWMYNNKLVMEGDIPGGLAFDDAYCNDEGGAGALIISISIRSLNVMYYYTLCTTTSIIRYITR